MYQTWRKLRPNCTSVTTAPATIAVGTGASTSLALTFNLNSDVYVPVPSNTTFSIASQATPLAAWTTHSWGYACTQ
jgi:hypothetical protein